MTKQAKLNLLLILCALVLFNSSCRKNVRGDVRIYGDIRDAYDNKPITNVAFSLFQRDKGSNITLLAPDISLDSTTGDYELKYITSENAKRGYQFRWQTNNTGREYYYSNFDYDSEIIDENECQIDIRLKRSGYMTIRLIDVWPYEYLPYLEFSCDGNQYPVELYNFNGDTTFTVKLIPDYDNLYELTSEDRNFVDTIIAGTVNMNASGDTLFNTLQY